MIPSIMCYVPPYDELLGPTTPQFSNQIDATVVISDNWLIILFIHYKDANARYYYNICDDGNDDAEDYDHE